MSDKQKVSTKNQYDALYGAFRYFNDELFGGELPEPLITFNWSKKTHGYLKYGDPWALREGDGGVAELSLTANTTGRDPEEVYSTFVHEMAHLWQVYFGKPSRNGYHNTEWANKMEEVGLLPYNVKEPTKRTGQGCSHKIEEDGRFQVAYRAMNPEFIFPFIGRVEQEAPKKKRKNYKTKYMCGHGDTFWGKPGLMAQCQDCNTIFEPQNNNND